MRSFDIYPGEDRNVESSKVQSPFSRKQIRSGLVWKVDRDRTGIGISCQDCVARIARKARDSNGPPATSNGRGCGGKRSSRTPVVNEHRSALRAGDHDRLSSVAGKVSSRDAVGAATVCQRKRRTRNGVEAAAAVTEQDRDGILSRMGDVGLIRDDDEIRVAITVEVIDGNLPGFGACKER